MEDGTPWPKTQGGQNLLTCAIILAIFGCGWWCGFATFLTRLIH